MQSIITNKISIHELVYTLNNNIYKTKSQVSMY